MKPTLVKKDAQTDQTIKAAPSGLDSFEHTLNESVAAFKQQRVDYDPRAAWRGLWRAER